MATNVREPCSDEWFRGRFQGAFGRAPHSDSELDHYTIEELIAVLDDLRLLADRAKPPIRRPLQISRRARHCVAIRRSHGSARHPTEQSPREVRGSQFGEEDRLS